MILDSAIVCCKILRLHVVSLISKASDHDTTTSDFLVCCPHVMSGPDSLARGLNMHISNLFKLQVPVCRTTECTSNIRMDTLSMYHTSAFLPMI